jgi:hypothetical protein
MTAKFPIQLRPIIEQAICHLWDKNFPCPDLTPVGDWLGLANDGWDYVVDGLFSSYFHIENIKEFFSDEMLIDYGYVVNSTDINNEIRIKCARDRINYLLSESMDSMHVINLESKKMPPAVLCILMYHHGQGGAYFNSIKVDFSVEDYIDSIKGDIILGQNYLSDQQILQNWIL